MRLFFFSSVKTSLPSLEFTTPSLAPPAHPLTLSWPSHSSFYSALILWHLSSPFRAFDVRLCIVVVRLFVSAFLRSFAHVSASGTCTSRKRCHLARASRSCAVFVCRVRMRERHVVVHGRNFRAIMAHRTRRGQELFHISARSEDTRGYLICGRITMLNLAIWRPTHPYQYHIFSSQTQPCTHIFDFNPPMCAQFCFLTHPCAHIFVF